MVYFNNIALGTRTDQKLNKHILKRDDYICQYCENSNLSRPISEHIIPYKLGGHTKPYNLVCSCRSCNAIKGCRIWIPNNLEKIMLINSQWAWKVINLFRHQKTYNVNLRYEQQYIDYGRNADIPAFL